jgi:hypothetical protein
MSLFLKLSTENSIFPQTIEKDIGPASVRQAVPSPGGLCLTGWLFSSSADHLHSSRDREAERADGYVPAASIIQSWAKYAFNSRTAPLKKPHKDAHITEQTDYAGPFAQGILSTNAL